MKGSDSDISDIALMKKLSDSALVSGISKTQKKDLLERSDLQGLIHLVGHVAVLVLGAGWILSSAPFWPLVSLPYSLALISLFMPLHETIHGTAFRTPWLNRQVAFVCGLIVVIPPIWFRYFHFEHHRFTNDPACDPELAYAKPDTMKSYFIYLTGLSIWLSLFRGLIFNALGKGADDYVPDTRRSAVRNEARIYCLIYGVLIVAAAMGAGEPIFWLWVLPIMIGQPFLRAYLLAEHMLCPEVPEMLANSRTVTSNALVRFFTWNMPYHAEHHLLPGVPFYRLPELHKLTKPHLRTHDTGYGDVHRQIRNSLK
jgi:fatty acid desaturase